MREAVSRKSLSFFAVGVDGANMEILAKIAPIATVSIASLVAVVLFVVRLLVF